MASRPKSSSSTARSGGRNYAKPTASSRPSSRAQQLLEQQQALAEKRQIVGQYMLGKTIGEGTFGKVKLAAHMPTGEKVAVKILEKSRIKEAADVRRVNREIKILKKARHPNVIQLYEVLDTQNAIYLIMECCDGGEMFDFIVAQKRVNEVQACKFFHQIVEGVDEIHKNEITHRDLKPENLLLKASPDGWIVKVVDFGLSNTHEGNRLLSTACGSPCYAAPEMIAGKKYVGPLADIWSMGVILFALVCGYLPFEDPNTAVLYKKILAGDYKAPKFISPEVRDLIARILETDPRRRYTMQDIRQHVWYTMVPESDVPKESVDVYKDERTRAETVALLGQAGIDTQALLDGLASHACNSLTAMYYLYEQKQRNLRAKSSNQQHSRPEILPANPATEIVVTTTRQSSLPTNNNANGNASNPVTAGVTPAPVATVAPPSTLPLHGVYRPVPPGQAPLIVLPTNNNGEAPVPSSTVAPVTGNARPVRPGAPVTSVTSATTTPAGISTVSGPPTTNNAPNGNPTTTANTMSNAAVVGAAPLMSLNMAPYLAAPPLLQQQQRQQQQHHGSPTNNHHKTVATNNPNQQQHNNVSNNNNHNLPSLDLYMKQGAQLPSIQQQQPYPSNNNNPIQRPLAVPPLQFSQQQQLQAQQKPLAGGSQSARAPGVSVSAAGNNTSHNVAPILGSLTARPNVSGPVNGHQRPGHTPFAVASVPAQQHQLLAVNTGGDVPVQIIPTALAGPDTESSGGRPNTRRSRMRSRGGPGTGQLDDEATLDMGPAIGSLDAPDANLSVQMQQLTIQPMEPTLEVSVEPTIKSSLISPSGGVRTGGMYDVPTAAMQPAQPQTSAPQKVIPEQPAAARGSSAQGGRRGRNLVPNSAATNANNHNNNVNNTKPQVSPTIISAENGSTVTPSGSSAREEAARNKTQQQTSFMLT